MTDYLSTRQAAQALGVPYQTLMSWIYGSKIHAERKGWCWYVHRDEVSRKRLELAA